MHVGRPLEPSTEAALRFLVAIGMATEAQLEAAAHQATRPAMMASFPLSGFRGMRHVGSDLVALGLAEVALGGLQPSARAEAFLARVDRDQQRLLQDGMQGSGAAIVGVPNEPLVYASILTELARLDDVLFVDPYLAADDLVVLQQLDTIGRVLTGSKLVHDRREQGNRRALLAIAVGKKPGLEVRTSREIHDRYAIPRSGAGLMLGASLGSAKMTTVIRLSDEVTATLRAHLEGVWIGADPVDALTAPAAPPRADAL